MDLNKPLRVIWLINGIAILLAIIYSTGNFLIEYFSRPNYNPSEVIVGEKLTDAQKEGLALQGLSVREALRVEGSSGGYLIPVGVETYEVPREIKDEGVNYKISGDIDYNFPDRHGIQIDDIDDFITMRSYINLVFTDDYFVVQRKLLDQKAFIASFNYTPEGYSSARPNPVPYIGYLICLSDTNADGAINEKDQSDLFISGPQGENLIQVTKGINIDYFGFLNSNQIFIEYQKTKEERKEYERGTFMIYQIDKKTLSELKSLNEALDAIEKGLSK